MNLYSNKQKWKIGLLILALLLVGASLYISNRIVKEVAKRERERVTQWADAIKKRAELVLLTNNSFDELRKKELNEMQLWIDATKEISKKSSLNSQQSYDFPFKIINKNKDIPVIILYQDSLVSTYINLDFSEKDIAKKNPELDSSQIEKYFSDSLVQLTRIWEENNPPFTIEIYDGLFMSYYYNDSKKILRLENERDSLINAFNKELIENEELVPVVLTNESKTEVIATNLSESEVDNAHLEQTLKRLASSNQPISIQFSEDITNIVFYASSPELVQLQYFPYIQFLMIGLFIFIGYIIFSTFRKAEQNQVWAGMAKETAHQLGTPISSLMAWIQLLENTDGMEETAKEMNKDIQRLTQVTERFSKIGATTQLTEQDIVSTVKEFLHYLRLRFSSKIELNFSSTEDEIVIPHNASLLEWVIENICKNAIDAMEGSGKIDVSIQKLDKEVYIEISDDGKGMTLTQQRNIFKPGFTTKKRGWGLGMTLAKRIIHEYHKGKLKIISSEMGKGTVFRITLYF